LLADRCDRYQQAVLEKQTAEEARLWRRKQTRKRRYLSAKLDWCPEEAAEQLRGFGEGLRFLIESIEKLITEVKSQGFLTPDVVDRGFELFGITPGAASIRANPVAYMIHVYNLGCTPGAPAGEVAGWLEPANRPEELRDVPTEALQGLDADGFRGLLLGVFQAERDELKDLQEAVERDVDQPSFKAALDGASILTDEAARRVARSHAESRTTFHRAWKELIATLKRDAEEGPPQPAGDDDEDQDEGGGGGGETRPVAEVAVTPAASAATVLPIDPENEAAELAQVIDQGPAYANPSAPGAEGAKPAQSGEQTRPKGADLGANPGRPGPNRTPAGEVLRRPATAEHLGACPSGCDPRHPMP